MVEIRIAARPGQLPVLRAVVGDLAMRSDFDVDAIADLRLAVEEACASLVQLAQPGSWLSCQLSSDAVQFAMTAEVESADGAGPRTDTFSWRVLTALADKVSTEVVAVHPGSDHLVRIELIKTRTVGP